MEPAQFETLFERRTQYAHSSFEYLEYPHVAAYAVLADTADLVLVYGKNESAGEFEAHWAANDPAVLIAALRSLGTDVLVSFVPAAWKADFLAQGFSEYGILRDYWIRDLSALPADAAAVPACPPLSEAEAGLAAAVTFACRAQSREFHGETPEWIRDWMRGEDPDAAAGGSRDCAVLGCYSGETLAGVVCVAIYGDADEAGAVLWVRELAVTPAFQGRGMGKALLKNALAYGACRGAKRAFLMADDCNAAAIHLYTGAGFAPGGDAQIDLIYRRE